MKPQYKKMLRKHFKGITNYEDHVLGCGVIHEDTKGSVNRYLNRLYLKIQGSDVSSVWVCGKLIVCLKSCGSISYVTETPNWVIKKLGAKKW